MLAPLRRSTARASMGGHAWLVTSEDAECERGRTSKIRRHCPMRLRAAQAAIVLRAGRHEMAASVRGGPKSYSCDPVPPRTATSG